MSIAGYLIDQPDPDLVHSMKPQLTPNDGDGNKEMALEKAHTPSLERLSSLPSAGDPALVDDHVTYPEGGLRAWLVVFGAWSGLAASLGVYNSTGVIEAYLSRELLRDESPSTIGWIFGVYAFMTWFCGAQVGPTFDAKGPRELLIAGSLCTLIGIFALSFSTGEPVTAHNTTDRGGDAKTLSRSPC